MDNFELQKYEQLMQLNQGLLVVFLVWAGAYLWLIYSFLKRFQREHNSLWQEIGSPTLLRKNGSLLRFLFSKRLSTLNPALQQSGKLLRYLTYIGVLLAILAFIILGATWQ